MRMLLTKKSPSTHNLKLSTKNKEAKTPRVSQRITTEGELTGLSGILEDGDLISCYEDLGNSFDNRALDGDKLNPEAAGRKWLRCRLFRRPLKVHFVRHNFLPPLGKQSGGQLWFSRVQILLDLISKTIDSLAHLLCRGTQRLGYEKCQHMADLINVNHQILCLYGDSSVSVDLADLLRLKDSQGFPSQSAPLGTKSKLISGLFSHWAPPARSHNHRLWLRLQNNKVSTYGLTFRKENTYFFRRSHCVFQTRWRSLFLWSPRSMSVIWDAVCLFLPLCSAKESAPLMDLNTKPIKEHLLAYQDKSHFWAGS